MLIPSVILLSLIAHINCRLPEVEKVAPDPNILHEWETKGFTYLGQWKRGSRRFGKTYYFLISKDLVSWDVARKVCSSTGEGNQLVAIEDKCEDEELLGFLASGGHHNVWTSGNDLITNGKYIWASTRYPIGPYTNWRNGTAPNDPNCACIAVNVHKAPEGCQQCPGGYAWDEEDCALKKKFVCELPIS